VQVHKAETSRLPYFLDIQLRDGGEVASLKRRPSFTAAKVPGTRSRARGHTVAGKFKSTEKFNDIGNETQDIPAYGTVPQPTALPRAPDA
jgi:hypothetical protein